MGVYMTGLTLEDFKNLKEKKEVGLCLAAVPELAIKELCELNLISVGDNKRIVRERLIKYLSRSPIAEYIKKTISYETLSLFFHPDIYSLEEITIYLSDLKYGKVAKATGLCATTVSRIAHGKEINPRAKTIEELSRYINSKYTDNNYWV